MTANTIFVPRPYLETECNIEKTAGGEETKILYKCTA
jgi:hypothetical protein